MLMYAVSCRGDQSKVEHKLPIVKLLLEHGADPNRKDARGTTALHCAFDQDEQEIADPADCPRSQLEGLPR